MDTHGWSQLLSIKFMIFMSASKARFGFGSGTGSVFVDVENSG